MRAILLIALSACAVDDTDVQEEALTQPPPFTPPTVPPILPTQQVCFLDGVHDLLSNGPGGGKIPNHPHTVAVDNSGAVIAGGGEAACMTALRSTIHYVGLGYDKGTLYGDNFYDGNANTHCFLQSIQGSSLDPGSVSLVRNGNTWSVAIINGNNPIPSAAGAVCFDDQPSSEWSYTFTATTDLRDSYPSGAVVPAYQVTCGLTALTGNWSLDNPNSKAWLDTRTNWYLTFDIDGPVTASLECLR